MIKEITIRKLVDYLLLNVSSINSSGLYNGKSGVALALFEAARFLQDDDIENKAFELFQECLVRPTKNYSFENGLSGIGYTLIYLITNKFIDADFNEIFNEQSEKIISDMENIDKYPDKLLLSLKIIYFLSALKCIHFEDIRLNQIIKQIFQGTELYLSFQFFDWKNIYYIKTKVDVLYRYSSYLKLIDFAKYTDFSRYLMDSYVGLYRKGRIVSSLSTGYYLNSIMRENNITQYRDVIDDNIHYGLKDIHPDTLSPEQKIHLTKIIENINADYGVNNLIDIDWLEQDFYKIKRAVPQDETHFGYQYGLARYLINLVNKEAILL